MFMDMRTFINWLDKHVEWDFMDKHFVNRDDIYTPMKHKGIYDRIGSVDIWNDVGCIEMTVDMYCPNGGGTVFYDVEYYYDCKKGEYVPVKGLF